MPRDHTDDMHSDAWWMRVLESELTPEEERQWHAHLELCQTCRREWEALERIDTLMRTATPPPALPPNFATHTVKLIARKQKRRRLVSFLAGLLIFTLVAWIGLAYFDTTLASLVRAANAIIFSRQILFAALVHTLTELAIAIKALLPLMLGITGAALLLITPNGAIATTAILWYVRKRRTQNTGTA